MHSLSAIRNPTKSFIGPNQSMDTDKRVASPYTICFYCSATHVTLQVLQPKTVNKRYRGQQMFPVSMEEMLKLFKLFSVRQSQGGKGED